MSAFFAWLESTGVAVTVRDSLMLTAALSAVHIVGFTLTTGGALVANLNLLGVLFRGRPAAEVTRPATRGILAMPLFRKLAREDIPTPTFLRSHPAPLDRVASAREMIQRLGPENVPDRDGRERYAKMMQSLERPSDMAGRPR